MAKAPATASVSNRSASLGIHSNKDVPDSGIDTNPTQFVAIPTSEALYTTLRELGVVDAASTPRLEPIARNPERRDYLTRASFRVFAGNRAICYLTVGKNLTDLRQRTKAFAEACPDIACKPLFWHQAEGWDYLGIELFEGQNLETLVMEGRLKSAEAVAHAAKIVSSLERTLVPCTIEAASGELERYFSWVCASPIFSGLDQQFLQSAIFPFIRNGALSGPQQSRWTNGDLIARNLLVDARGEVRLVDYEFASRTCFFAEDALRWRSESKLPTDALDLPGIHGIAADRPWVEAFFILRHAVLIHEINGASVAVFGLRQQMDRLVALAAAAHAGFRASVFFQPLLSTAPSSSTGIAPGGATAQLYWAANAAFSEMQSLRRDYASGKPTTVSFLLPAQRGPLHLRLDPAEASGIITISGIRIRRHPGGALLVVIDENTGWDALQIGSGLLRLGDSPALNLLSLGGDPNFYLPELSVGDTPCDLVCEVWWRFSPDLAALPDLLRPLFSEPAGRAQAEAALENLTLRHAQLEEELRKASTELQALQIAAAQSAESTLALGTELAALRRELQAREQSLAETRAKAEAEAAARIQTETAMAALTGRHSQTEEDLRQTSSAVQTLQLAAAQSAESTRSLEKELAAQTDALRVERTNASKVRWQRVLLQKKLSATQASLLTEQESRRAFETTAARQERQLRDLNRHLNQREDKIARMQRSFSWKASSPLRWLRRQLLDRPARPVPPAPLDTLLVLDTPAIWHAAPANGEIVGWCLYPDGHPLDGVRARTGPDLVFDGVYGLTREDVANAHGFPIAESRACGFKILYNLQVDTTYHIIVEARGNDGQWRSLAERSLHTTAHPRNAHDYTAWVEAFDTLTPDKVAGLRQQVAAIDERHQPLLSVLLPVYNTPERWLNRAIESVVEQIYPHWELCIADDASSKPQVRQILEQWKEKDSRIHVVYREINGHISAASNSALELAKGEFVALLDHDDEIPAHALAEVVLCLARHPDTDLVYSDEDKIDEDGIRSEPYFKPDFQPDLLLGQNYICHLSVFRTRLVRTLGGFRAGFEGSQDWDLDLRVCDAIDPERIRHVPKILYHWRSIAGSTSGDVNAKNYAHDSGRRALEDHFKRCALRVDLKPAPGNHWRVSYPLPAIPPLVSIIIPNKNQVDLLRNCMASLIATTAYPSYEILLLDNGSDEPTAQRFIQELSDEVSVSVLRYDAPFNYSAINNFGVRHARGDVLCFLNNDIEVVDENWLGEMVSHALRPEIGAVGTLLLFPDDRVQHAGVVLGIAGPMRVGGVAGHVFKGFPRSTDGYFNRLRMVQNYSAVTAACLVVRRKVFDAVGGFNETELPVAFNDVDFCLRVLKAGYRNLWTPYAAAYHHESASRGAEDTAEKQQRFKREIEYMRITWGAILDADPAYNPNLTLLNEDFSLAFPPR